ncbi:Uncharacterised protein [Zhongshania aliphaticivorans]|uniref:DUF2061 domain-containing protein n=1 Tax=Zhongshania aliphaticivorans TaxID=1470434 RepID=A0A5S9P3K2_9GAMM|nr:DUF2061 domain-containing protein [Zhongshania aliphaticivorans]CAA0090433.1 Uncharacterised protein [Zhongshania aliphaticivorans]CAA0097894.1 Uncharacterised protein [Zhongshania aliphaticivorans]
MKKTISFAMMHFTVAFSVAYILTGSAVVGGMLALIEPAVNTVVFYFHEKAWLRLDRGPRPLRQDAAMAVVRA